LKTYYFHNIFYDNLFTDPSCRWMSRINTDWVFHNIKNEYKVIIVGDASMAPSELLLKNGNIDYYRGNEESGLTWLKKLKKRYPAVIWLNPLHVKLWHYDYSSRTIGMVEETVPMFPLTVHGLEDGIKELLEKA